MIDGSSGGPSTRAADRVLSRAPELVVGAATILVALLSWYQIGYRSFWFDEAVSYYLTAVGWDRLIELSLTGQQGWHPPSYFIALKAWRSVIGGDEVALRAFSSVFAVLSVPALYLVASQLTSRWTAAFAAVVFSCNAYLIEYAQEARTYTFTMFLAIVSYWLLLASVREPRRAGPWIAYVVTAVIGMYSFLFFALIVAAQAATLLLPGLRPVSLRPAVASYVAIGVLSAPIGIVGILQRSAVDWIAPIEWVTLPRLFQDYAGGNPAAMAAYSAGLVLALGWLAGPGRGWRGTWLLSLWVLLPALGLAMASLVKPLLVFRYVLVSLPALAFAVAFGISRLSRWAVASLACVVLLSSALAVNDWYRSQISHLNWREVAQILARRAEPDDAVVLWRSHFYRLPLAYQVTRLGLDGLVPPLINPPLPWTWNEFRDAPPPDTGAAARLAACELDRIWVVSGPEDVARHGNDTLTAVVSAGYGLEDTLTVGNVNIRLWSRTGEPCP